MDCAKYHQISRPEQNIQHGICAESRQLQPANHQFQGFPVEVLDHIARFLPFHELLTFSRVSRTCYQIASHLISSGIAFVRSGAGSRLPLCYQPEYFSFTVSPWLQAVNPEEAERLESCKHQPNFPEALNLSVANTIAGFPALQLYRITHKKHISVQEDEYPLMSPDGMHVALCSSSANYAEEMRLYQIGGIMEPLKAISLPAIPRIRRCYFSDESRSFIAETMKHGLYISKQDEEGNWGHYQQQAFNDQRTSSYPHDEKSDSYPDYETLILQDKGLPAISDAVRFALSPNKQHIVAKCPSTIKIFSRHSSGQWVQSFDSRSLQLKYNSERLSLEENYSPDGRHLVLRFPRDNQPSLSLKQAPILTWNQQDMIWESRGTVYGNRFIYHVSFSPNSILLGAVSVDNHLQVYSRTHGGIWQKKGQFHFREPVHHVSFTKDNFHIIVSGADRMHYLTIGKKRPQRYHPY
ncbi:F-box/WD repeat-containing protein [Parendozoicomonas haliclonae]|uniref:F-box domain-containing protein n=1 Tax=Parendozoicomonas haliclonae TaxID=1960125 RepID=A0A1X7AQ48_9GAMM|nr:F-box protein [Parendozoicomonas haliclonae]SMA50219.1 hypothetical protein EHSB41UT_04012 [Parendozoicomonas haliclonae]